jgi:hypothetical protein
MYYYGMNKSVKPTRLIEDVRRHHIWRDVQRLGASMVKQPALSPCLFMMIIPMFGLLSIMRQFLWCMFTNFRRGGPLQVLRLSVRSSMTFSWLGSQGVAGFTVCRVAAAGACPKRCRTIFTPVRMGTFLAATFVGPPGPKDFPLPIKR